MNDSPFYINIGRQFGAGGLEIGEKLSKYFSIHFYDKELLNIASQSSGINKTFFENADEAPTSFKSGYLGLTTTFGISDYGLTNIIESENLFNIQSEVIRKIASSGSAIFIGRCADYILRENENVLNVFIYADIASRLDRIRTSKRFADVNDMNDKQLAEIIKKGDKKRSEYYNYYTFKKWGDISSYHLCIDSSKLGIELCTSIIIDAVERRIK